MTVTNHASRDAGEPETAPPGATNAQLVWSWTTRLRRPIRLMATVLAAFAMLLAACGDGEQEADPTPPGIGDDDTNATVPGDDDGAVGEPDDEDSQTDTTDPGASVDEDIPNDDSDTADAAFSGDDVVPTSNRARVFGSFGDQELDLLLTEDARCTIREPVDAGGEAAAEVLGATADGAEFSLDWSVDDGALRVRLVLDGIAWTVDEDLDDSGERLIHLTRNGEVLMGPTFQADGGRTADAQLFVNCQPADG